MLCLPFFVVFCSLFHHCFGVQGRVEFETFSSDGIQKWMTPEQKLKAAKKPIIRPGFKASNADGHFPVLSPAIYRKPKEHSVHIWIWVKSPLPNIPFTNRRSEESVYIPTNLHDWTQPWFYIRMRRDETGRVYIKKVMEVEFEREKCDESTFEHLFKGEDCLIVDSFERGEVSVKPRRAFREKSFDDVQRLLDTVHKDIYEQLQQHLRSLFDIIKSINDNALHPIITWKGVLFMHPFHARADNNKWIVVKHEHGSNVATLPFIGQSKEAKSAEAFELDSIEKEGIHLEGVTDSIIQFGKMTEYGLSFTLKTPTDKEDYEIYWYPQVLGGCVLHSLKSALQGDGVGLTAQECNAYSQRVSESCSYCGRSNSAFLGPDSLYHRNLKKLEAGEHVPEFNYCGTEVYLMEHEYGLLQLNMEEVKTAMERVTDTEHGPKYFFDHIMINAFKLLFESAMSPHILTVAANYHARTYLKMNTISDTDGFWLSLDSSNYGPKQVPDILAEIKRNVLKDETDEYIIYAVYPPSSPFKLHKLENFWIPQILKGDTCDTKATSGGHIVYENDLYGQKLYDTQGEVDYRAKQSRDFMWIHDGSDLQYEYEPNTVHNGYSMGYLAVCLGVVLIFVAFCCIMVMCLGIIGYLFNVMQQQKALLRREKEIIYEEI